MIQRIDFLGFTVVGPRNASKQSWKASDWPGWTASLKGQAVLLEGEGKVIEVPRAKCVITSVPDKEPA